jgi:hypothetical protein
MLKKEAEGPFPLPSSLRDAPRGIQLAPPAIAKCNDFIITKRPLSWARGEGETVCQQTPAVL